MSERAKRSGRQSGLLGGFLPDERYVAPTPIPARNPRPPKVWGSLVVEGEELALRLTGWRSVMAVKRRVAIPLASVVNVSHDPAARLHVATRIRHRRGRTGLVRVGVYHSHEGWSFWSIGLARNAVVVEASGARYRFLIVEVADPVTTLETVRQAAGLASVSSDASREEPPST